MAENLLQLSKRQTQQVMRWIDSPQWHPTQAQLEAMRTSTRGAVLNLRTGAYRAVTACSGEISSPR